MHYRRVFCHKLGSKRRFGLFWGRKRPPGESPQIAVLIHHLWRSAVNFPQENKVFQRPCRSVLLPSYLLAATVVN